MNILYLDIYNNLPGEPCELASLRNPFFLSQPAIIHVQVTDIKFVVLNGIFENSYTEIVEG